MKKPNQQLKSNLEQMIRRIPDGMKLDFLRKALENNESLRNQFTVLFYETIQEPPDVQPDNPGECIGDTVRKLKNELETLDFDNMNWRKYIPRHSGYVEDYEAWENFAEDHLDEILDGWRTEILNKLKNGQIIHAVCLCLGMYDACLNAVIPGAENIFEDLSDILLQKHQEMLTESVDAIGQTIMSELQAMKSVEVLLDHYPGKYRGMKDYLRDFEPLLITLTGTGKTAARILEFFETSAIDQSWVPALALKIASFDEDPSVWLEKAEEYMELDLGIAKQLLDHYWTDDPDCFLRVGQRLFRDHQAELCDYFSELLYPRFDEGFYCEVLQYRTRRDSNTDLYKVLRDYLNEEEKAKFADEIVYNDAFKVSILAIEKNYPGILKLAQKEALHTWHFAEMITPILNIYPAEVFELIRVRCEDELRNHKKRSGYKRVAEWLKLSIQIHSEEVNAMLLINQYYTRKPALPALKEEMRKAGVVAGR